MLPPLLSIVVCGSGWCILLSSVQIILETSTSHSESAEVPYHFFSFTFFLSTPIPPLGSLVLDQ